MFRAQAQRQAELQMQTLEARHERTFARSTVRTLHAGICGTFCDKQGDEYAQPTLTTTNDQREKVVLVKPCIIPVLFIPGIMGTNLRKKGDKEQAWRPPNLDLKGGFDAIGQLVNYLGKSTKKRAEELKTEDAEIDPRGPIDTGESGLPKNVLVARGWGCLMSSSYHPFMGKLQNQLNQLAEYDPKTCEVGLKEWAANDAKEAPTDWGAANGEPLTEEEIKHAANYQFDVWAAGYNWLQSNRDSGKAIQDLIEKTILPYYNDGKEVVVDDTPDGQGKNKCSIQRKKPLRPRADQVIVLTHSMGGLVSRALTEIHQCDKVMGVSHGVQPATGAPATYKRMRSGFEGVEQVFLGRNAADVVAILSQAPGGLELLPTADYNGGQPWLKLRDKSSGKVLMDLPKINGDPYSEIYTSPAWYGMVPEANTGLMVPGGAVVAANDDEQLGSSTPRSGLEETIHLVKTFHEAIKAKYKTPTYAHFGAQGRRDKKLEPGGLFGTGLNIPLIASSPKNLFTWGEVAWEGDGLAALDPTQMLATGYTFKDDGNGELTLGNGTRLTIGEPNCPGDGTVPVYSGEAPNQAGIAMSFGHGHGNPGKHNEKFGYDHQGSYGDHRSLYASMYAIVKIAQKAQWHKA